MSDKTIEKAYEVAKDQYAALGVDTDKAMQRLAEIPISIHCWQGDDVAGFERPNATLDGGGIQATGNYPGKARTIDELRGDFEKAISLIPGKKRMNLHACYIDNGGKFVERDAIGPEHFQSWIDWAKSNQLGLDFNPTYFSHPKAESGFTLAHPDKGIRDFWIEHGKRCREIGAAMGKQLGTPTITNIWIPDGYKDIPVDRHAPRQRLKESLDAILKEKIDKNLHKDAVESKLFGIGAESYTVGSHEFYLGYAVANQLVLCLDAGHYHPTEVISEKFSACLCFLDEMLLHVSRPVRWDSDHVVILNDELLQTATEIVRGNATERVHIGLDFFDASINRIAAWVIGTRAMYQALMIALLEPVNELKGLENGGDYTGRLAMVETLKSRMWGAVWDMYCLRQGVPAGGDWMCDVRAYEKDVLSTRS